VKTRALVDRTSLRRELTFQPSFSARQAASSRAKTPPTRGSRFVSFGRGGASRRIRRHLRKRARAAGRGPRIEETWSGGLSGCQVQLTRHSGPVAVDERYVGPEGWTWEERGECGSRRVRVLNCRSPHSKASAAPSVVCLGVNYRPLNLAPTVKVLISRPCDNLRNY
jgi:hypothetical protein